MEGEKFHCLNLEKKIELVFEGCCDEAFEKKHFDETLNRGAEISGAKVKKTIIQEFPFEDQKKSIIVKIINFFLKLFGFAVKNEGHPPGITIVKILSESHIAGHTYVLESESRTITISMATCGQHADPERAIDFFIERFKPKRTFRGILAWKEIWKETT